MKRYLYRFLVIIKLGCEGYDGKMHPRVIFFSLYFLGYTPKKQNKPDGPDIDRLIDRGSWIASSLFVHGMFQRRHWRY